MDKNRIVCIDKEIKSLGDFLNIVNSEKESDAYELFYRAEACDYKDTSLLPAIFRNKLFEHEHDMFQEIVKRFPEQFPKGIDALEALATMKHYTLPTRLLDISRSVFVPLYFACEDHPDEDGFIFVFSVPKKQIKDWDSDTVRLLANIAKMDAEYKVDGTYHKKAFDKLMHEIKNERSHFFNMHENNEIEYVKVFNQIICVEAKLTNPRIRNQQGLFFLWGINGDKSNYNNLDFDLAVGIKRIRIPYGIKKTILSDLNNIGFDATYVYPDLENVCKHFTKKFEVKPEKKG